MKEKLKNFYRSTKYHISNTGDALLIDNVFNLVSKDNYSDMASYDILLDAILDMAYQMEVKDIKKLAIPHLGCGKDKLEWNEVIKLIEKTFDTTDVDILVCTL